MAKQSKTTLESRIPEYEFYTLSRKKDAIDVLKSKYTKSQNKPWGLTSIVEGYYFIAELEPTACSIPAREQALATVHWKQNESDYFNTEFISEFLIGALYNKHSNGPAIEMGSLPGKTIQIIKVEKYMKDKKKISSITWELAEDKSYMSDDIIADLFYITDEENELLHDEQKENELLESSNSLEEITPDEY